MKFSYKFSGLLGSVYGGGDLLFSPGETICIFKVDLKHFSFADGNTVISPVGNKISMFDLKNHR